MHGSRLRASCAPRSVHFIMTTTTTTTSGARGGLRRLYGTLWAHAEGHRGRLVAALAMLVVAQAVRVAIPWLFGCAVNALQVTGIDGLIEAGWYLLAMFAAACVAWMLHGPARVLERRTALHAREQLADSLFARFLSLPLRWHEKHHSGDTLHRLQKTTTALFGFAQHQFVYLQNLVSIVGPIAALIAVSAITGSVALVGYTIVALLLLRFDRVMVRLVREENAAERKYTSAVVDGAGNISTVLTLGLDHAVRASVREKCRAVSKPLSRGIVVNEAKWATVDLLNNLPHAHRPGRPVRVPRVARERRGARGHRGDGASVFAAGRLGGGRARVALG